MKASAFSVSEMSEAAADALRTADVFGDRVNLTCGQLTKSVYDEVNTALERLGGRWSGRDGVHIFDLPFQDRLTAALAGEVTFPAANPGAFFPTPVTLARTVVARSRAIRSLRQGAVVLEPNLGRGALVDALRELRPDLIVEACEIDEAHRAAMRNSGIKFVGSDFLELPEEKKYDLVLANPPFALAGDKSAWVTHLEKMTRVLKPSGGLIAIVPAQIEFATQRRIAALRELVAAGGRIERNAPNAFAESGTHTKTATIYLGPGEAGASDYAERVSSQQSQLPSLEECIERTKESLRSAIACAEGLLESHSPAEPEVGSENIYWREVTGPVFDKGHLFVNAAGAVIYWSGQEAAEAQGALMRMANPGAESPRPLRRRIKAAAQRSAA